MLPWVVNYRPHPHCATRHFRPLALSRLLSPLFSISSALFQVPYPASPLFATLTKTAGCVPTIPNSELTAQRMALNTPSPQLFIVPLPVPLLPCIPTPIPYPLSPLFLNSFNLFFTHQ